MNTIRLEDTKIEDASYGLAGLFKELVWLEKNGFVVSKTTQTDIIGLGCGIYENRPEKVHDVVTIQMMKREDWVAAFNEDTEKLKKILEEHK